MIRMRSGAKRAAANLADAALRLLAPLLVTGRSTGVVPPNPRVLVIRCDHIGDAVMATGSIAALRRALNPARLDILAGPWAAPLFEQHSAVDSVLTVETPWWLAARGASRASRLRAWTALPGIVRRLRSARYDVAVDLRGDLRQILFFVALSRAQVRVSSDRTGGTALLTRTWRYDAAQHEVAKDFAIMGLLGASGPPALAPPALDPLPTALAEAVAGAAGPNGVLAIATRGTEPNRAWPAANAAQLLRAVRAELGLGAVYVGTQADRATAEEISTLGADLTNLAGRTTLREALAVFRASRAAVTVDSGPMHLAALAGTPVVALFGPGDPAECRPWGTTSVVACTTAPCGCEHPTCDYEASGAGRCMRNLQPETVLHQLRSVLAA